MRGISQNFGAKLWGVGFALLCMALAVGCAPPDLIGNTGAPCGIAASTSPGTLMLPLSRASMLPHAQAPSAKFEQPGSSSLFQYLERRLPAPGSADSRNPVKMYGALAGAIDDDSKARGFPSEDRQQQLRVVIVLAGDSDPELATQPLYIHLVDSVEQFPDVRTTVDRYHTLVIAARQLIASRKVLPLGDHLMSSSDTTAAVATMTSVSDDVGDTTVSASVAVSAAISDKNSGLASFSPDTSTVLSINFLGRLGDTARVVAQADIYAAYDQGFTPEFSLHNGCSATGVVITGSGAAHVVACTWCWSAIKSLAKGVVTGGIVAWVRHGTVKLADAEDALGAAIVGAGLSALKSLPADYEALSNIIAEGCGYGCIPRRAPVNGPAATQ